MNVFVCYKTLFFYRCRCEDPARAVSHRSYLCSCESQEVLGQSKSRKVPVQLVTEAVGSVQVLLSVTEVPYRS